ncbi:hypothetical protein LshimejAT787_0501590 [Lyophyllum shimeji]|uniref:DUF6534 domain-containing protein n=1 Tax=Lyophyllum shimeji TaxID=47721 RepID=A0A9P3PMS2_LYOSH|nr:hypothetical protein LshimejAT787_0501590 [Lyophyllum shimeji]
MGDVDLSFGAYLLGAFLNTYFYGLVTFQYMSYHGTKFGDPWYIRALVFFLFSRDTADSVAIVRMAWIYSLQLYRHPEAVPNMTWLYAWTNASFSITALVVQTFLAYRIYRLKGSIIAFSFTCLLSVVSFFLGIIITIFLTRLEKVAEAVDFETVTIVWQSFETGVDWINAGTLTIILLRSRNGLRGSNELISRLIRVSLQTGLLPTICTTVSLILFMRYPNTQLFGTIGLPLGRMYSATIMDTLLVRQKLREIARGRATATSTIWKLGSLPGAHSFPSISRNTGRDCQLVANRSAAGVDLDIPSGDFSDVEAASNDVHLTPA